MTTTRGGTGARTGARPSRRASSPRTAGRRRRPAARRRPPAQGWAAWVPVLLVTAAVLIGVAWIAEGPDRPPLTGACTVTGTSLAISTEQAMSAATIAAVAHTRDLPERAVVVALATALQESGLRNLDHGDRDSLGLFQQRPSQGWGSEDQVQDPVHAAGKFYDGLVRVPGWDSRRLTDVAQAVQRSGFPEAYQKHEPQAQSLASALTSAEPGRLTCDFEPSPTGGRLSERTAAVAAAVEAELGVAATEEFGAVAVDPGAGWQRATWAVAHAERLQLASVSLAGHVWTPDGGWTPAGAAQEEGLQLELVP